MSSRRNQCSVVIVPYNHEGFIEACIGSVLKCDPKEIIVVDGGSSDATREIVRGMGPPVELITVEDNPGYGACNNIGVKHASGEYVLILNPDTKVQDGALGHLLEPLGPSEETPTITVPKLLTYDGSVINTCGNINHITGLAFVQGYGDRPDEWSERSSLTALSGACFAMRRADYQRLNGFDESIFLYMEDVEFSWRLNAFGESIQFVPEAVVHHDYDDVEVDDTKLKHLEIGRYIILKKYLSKEATLRLLPSLMMTELLTLGYAILLGRAGVEGKLQAIREAASTEVESVAVDARRLLRSLDAEIPEGQLGDSAPAIAFQRVANLVFRANARILNI